MLGKRCENGVTACSADVTIELERFSFLGGSAIFTSPFDFFSFFFFSLANVILFELRNESFYRGNSSRP